MNASEPRQKHTRAKKRNCNCPARNMEWTSLPHPERVGNRRPLRFKPQPRRTPKKANRPTQDRQGSCDGLFELDQILRAIASKLQLRSLLRGSSHVRAGRGCGRLGGVLSLVTADNETECYEQRQINEFIHKCCREFVLLIARRLAALAGTPLDSSAQARFSVSDPTRPNQNPRRVRELSHSRKSTKGLPNAKY